MGSRLSVVSVVSVSVVYGRFWMNGVSTFVYDCVETIVVISGVGHFSGSAIRFD